jgi:TPR repeat protein
MNMLRAGVLAALVLVSPGAFADLYAAKAAYEKKDYAAAFVEFRALAELGHPLAQESLAIMHATGQGVPRDGIRAYAWAKVARENGAGDRARIMIDQLQPFITAESRKVVDDIHSEFGRQALEKRLLPLGRNPNSPVPPEPTCRMARPVNPNRYYPSAAYRQGISGSLLIQTPVHTDGRARNPRVIFGFPPETFSSAGRKIAFDIGFEMPVVNGARVPCTVAFWTFFATENLRNERAVQSQFEPFRVAAEAGDPTAQLHYAVMMNAWQELTKTKETSSWMLLRSAQAGIPSAQYIVGVSALGGGWFAKDRAKGMQWLEMASTGGQSEARVALARALLSDARENLPRARELLEKAVEEGSKDARYFLADLLVGDPEPARRDPRRALELLDYDYRPEDPGVVEIRGAAYSQLGQFKMAVNSAKTALAMGRSLEWDVAPLAERLALYQKKQAWSGLLLSY